MNLQTIKIAILAMGGEGGGVLADWLVDLGEHNGYHAQSTSVPGVAQRTGATVYYVELFPDDGSAKRPVLALMPMPGDVDVVIASELMEAGRAVQRGLVTPARTTLITSTHRVYSIAEKSAMGDGRVDAQTLLGHARAAAKRCIALDMDAVAQASGSVISPVMFGALAAAGVLPFAREQFEETIVRGGVGVKPSLRAFAAAHARAQQSEADGTGEVGETTAQSAAPPQPQSASSAASSPQPDAAPVLHPAIAALLARVRQDIPAEAQTIVIEGLRRLVDYQDVRYGVLYLDRLAPLAVANADPDLLRETARHLALWMSYEDAIRVAALKTRSSRFARVQDEVRSNAAQILMINEYLHPRVEEISEILPSRRLARWLMRPSWGNRVLSRLTRSGRVIRTSSISGFLLLYVLARCKAWRRRTLRYQLEQQRIEDWLRRIHTLAQAQPDLAREVAQCQRLVKGYGDTHARGWRNYQTVMAAVDRRDASLSPAVLADLRDAALADESGQTLQQRLCQHGLTETLSETPPEKP